MIKSIIRSCILRIVCSLLLLCLLITGCSKPREFDDEPKLPTHQEGATDEDIVSRYDKIVSNKVRIISMGDQYMISVPSKVLFANQSPKIKAKSYEVLDDIVAYLQSFRKISVKVSAYSDCYQSKARTMALTKARAKAVGLYLWTRNVESRVVITEGFGNDNPIVAKQTGDDSSPNSRIEITFKQVLV